MQPRKMAVVRVWPYGFRAGDEIMLVGGRIGNVECVLPHIAKKHRGCIPVAFEKKTSSAFEWIPADDVAGIRTEG